MKKSNLWIIRQSFANTVFTHKVHESASESQGKKAVKVKIVNIVIVSLVLILLITQSLFPQQIIFTYISTGISVAEIIFLIIQLSFIFDEKASQHKSSALKFMGLRDRYKNLIADIMEGNISKKDVVARRDMLQDEYQTICDLSSQTQDVDYKSAQIKLNKKGLRKGEEFTWSDEEIDHFLPKKLHITK
ncbi:MAG: hypothetical protein ACD_19C00017G0027 [uncultured bacterium]|nr:MAG: hypothetical protein ACD_19C00017G0027 [uncultured bacterium]